MESCFAYWRLPGRDNYCFVASERTLPLDLSLMATGMKGYAIAPFEQSGKCPSVLIPSDRYEEAPVPAVNDECHDVPFPLQKEPDASYSQDFACFHAAVLDGRFSKLVLSRSREMITVDEIELEATFFRACHAFRDMMVALFSTPQTGTWIVSTPEPLFECRHGQAHTVALAGTMLKDGTEPRWSTKNRHEQKIVSDFISGALAPICQDIRKEGPQTVDAGSLVHLKTDIWFEADEKREGDFVRRLHPTPAVCGLPREEAKAFILANESCDRTYFSGYSGPIGLGGATRLFVSLRCAAIAPDRRTAVLYAGGGIMPESECRSEFIETENKMQNIAKCIRTRQISTF